MSVIPMVIDKHQGERSYDYSRRIKRASDFLTGEVEDRMANLIVARFTLFTETGRSSKRH